MKKTKFAILTLAILFSVCAAFVSNRKFDCRTATQYYWNGQSYVLAGTIFVNYSCEGPTSQVCTYWFTLGQFQPCYQNATYTPINLHSKSKK